MEENQTKYTIRIAINWRNGHCDGYQELRSYSALHLADSDIRAEIAYQYPNILSLECHKSDGVWQYFPTKESGSLMALGVISWDLPIKQEPVSFSVNMTQDEIALILGCIKTNHLENFAPDLIIKLEAAIKR